MSFEQGFKDELQKLAQIEELALPGRIDTSVFPQMSEIERQALESEMANKQLLEEEQKRRGTSKYVYPGLMAAGGYGGGAMGGTAAGISLEKMLARAGKTKMPGKLKGLGPAVGALVGAGGGMAAGGIAGALTYKDQQEKEQEAQQAIERLLGRTEKKRQYLYEQAGYPAPQFMGTPTFGDTESPYPTDPGTAAAAVAAQRLAEMRGGA